jgi:hypothetical protein
VLYSQFEEELLVAIVKTADANSAADPNSRGQVDVMVVATQVSPDTSEPWIRSAVGRFKGLGWVCNVMEPIRPRPNSRVTSRQIDSKLVFE